MAQGFRWTRRGFVAELEKAEVRLLRGLVRDVMTLLENRRDEVAPDGGAARGERPASGAGAEPSEETPAAPAAGRDDDPFWALVGGLSLSAEDSPGRPAPEDPAVARLLPDARPDAEPEERDRHRALAEDAVLDAKLDDARRALAALQSTRVVLPHEQAVSFGRALNDVRLVLATRLGVEDEEDARRVHELTDWRQADDLESTMALLYNFTTWLLDTLMEEMLTELPEDGEEPA